ncbi:MAG: hypothetical protein OEW08_12255 [Gammaproteobacteria bacterium]|nr:hypothetical protein [Gammaproteobacteria bacterium]
MKIQSASVYSALSRTTILPHERQQFAAPASALPSLVDTSTLSPAARTLWATQSNSGEAQDNAAKTVLDTTHGRIPLDLDDYFKPISEESQGASFLTAHPLLLPSQRNIDVLTAHASAKLKELLAQNNIPSAPASIKYDSEGNMQLPSDYPYASQFKQALDNNPPLAKNLRSINALASHWAEIKKRIPFHQEYAAASSQAEADAVVEKYSYLFSRNQHYSSIELHFSTNGLLSVTADGELLST